MTGDDPIPPSPLEKPEGSKQKNHKKDSGRSWSFHPLEIAFCGYSGSGKTTLISRLIPELGANIGFVKHDVHRFTMDYPGKDTYEVKKAGATSVFISNQGDQALLRSRPWDPQLGPLDFLDRDALVVEGHKNSPLGKIIVLDQEKAILQDPAFSSELAGSRVLAVAGPWEDSPELPWKVPYFQRDRIVEIANFIKSFWAGKTQARPLYGLVLTGGKSLRMGQDKAALEYHGEPQAHRAFGLLEKVCSQVFISCLESQKDLPGRRGHPQIWDRYLDLGPLSGILSALEAHPEAAWLVVACDLPYLNAEALEFLVNHRNPFTFATAYRGQEGFPEPLCTIYEPKSRPRFFQFLAMGYDCPRKMLINSPIERLELPPGKVLDNINENHEREKVLNDLGS